MSHREAGVGPAARRPEAQEGEGEPELNPYLLPSLRLGLRTRMGLTHAGRREFTHIHTCT